MRVNLAELWLEGNKVKDWKEYPFSIPIIKNLNRLTFTNNITFFVGENGSGKSTLLEAIANKCGFGKEGGSKNISFQTYQEPSSELADVIMLSWTKKILNGYYFRAESFFNLASYLDNLDGGAVLESYGGKSLHQQSHGESFLALFKNRFSRGGFFLLDEPEAALSPQRQLSFLVVLKKILKNNDTQFIIATHSPILLSFPNAQILSFDDEKIHEITYEETNSYQIIKSFINHRERYLQRLFEDK